MAANTLFSSYTVRQNCNYQKMFIESDFQNALEIFVLKGGRNQKFRNDLKQILNKSINSVLKLKFTQTIIFFVCLRDKYCSDNNCMISICLSYIIYDSSLKIKFLFGSLIEFSTIIIKIIQLISFMINSYIQQCFLNSKILPLLKNINTDFFLFLTKLVL